MRFLALTLMTCMLFNSSLAGDDKQVKLEDIEQDTLTNEEKAEPEQEQKELQQPTQHIQLSYSNDPQDIFVTPQPRYNSKGQFNLLDSPADLRSQVYHLPKVHEAEQTYSVPAKQSLIQPFIGGSQPIQPHLTPQPQYIYVQSPHHHQSYMPQAHSYVMVPYAQQYTPQPQIHVQPQHHHHQAVLQQPVLSTPEQSIFTYSRPQVPSNHQQSYQAVKSIEYSLPASPVTQLQTSVDYKSSGEYKNSAPLPIVPRKTLPSYSTTSFQQFYSPGLEYHYTEAIPVTKLSPHSSYSYQNAPTHNYHTNYVSQTPSYNYYHSAPNALTSYNKHQSSGLLESYVPSLVTYRQQQQPQYKNYYPTQYHQQYSSTPVPQQLFTPSQSSHYAPYPSSQAYNTIQYSVPMPAYDHSKRSTSKATANLSVKAPKTT